MSFDMSTKEALIDHQPEQIAKRFDVDEIREDFPILHREVYGKPLVFLDNAASTQKPKMVIERIKHYYENENANVHRGVYYLSEIATSEYEGARETIRCHLNARSSSEIIFVKGTTEGINLVASSYGRKIGPDDEIIISSMEHHSNIVPWQILCEDKGAKLRIIPMNDNGELIMDQFDNLFNKKTKLVSIVYISNSLGTINPVKDIIEIAHENNVPVLLDAAQALPHIRVDVNELDCDFFVFSGHKIFGPTGIGILYAKEEILETMAPYQAGGDMIKSVTFEKTLYTDLPHRFEAGTPNIAGVIGLAAALDYVNDIGYENIQSCELELMNYAEKAISGIKHLKQIGTAQKKAGVISFIIDGIHAHDVATILDREGIAVRSGHHCTQPVMQRFNISGTARASFVFYNKLEEVDRLVEGIYKVIDIMH